MTPPLRRTAPAATAALLGIALLAGCGGKDTPANDPSGDTTSATSPASPTSPTTTAAAAPSSSTAGAASHSQVVYWIGRTPMGDRLYAENDPITAGTSPTDAALATLLRGKPADTDYRSAVPDGSIASVKVTPGKDIEVAVAGAKWAGTQGDTAATEAKLAVQQVVATFNAAAGVKKPLPVHFTLDGKPSTYLGQPATAKAGVPTRTMSLMNVLSPLDGATLPSGKQVFSGVSNSFEANVAWTITDSSGKKVLHGATTSDGWMDSRLHPWKANVDLSKLGAGAYTFEATTGDGGEGEGGGPFTDTKRIVVK